MTGAIRPHRSWAVVGVAAGVLWTAARVSIPWISGQAIDKGVDSTSGRLLVWIVLLLVAGVFQAVFTGLRRYAAFRLALRVETDIRMRLVAHLQRLHFGFHDSAQTGQLMANANSDIAQINNVVLLIPLTIASTLTMIAVIVVLVLASPGLAFFALVSLPLLQLAATRFSHKMYPIGSALQDELARYSGSVEESITGIRVVKGFGAEARQIRNVDAHADSVYARSMDAAYLRAWFLPLIDLLPTMGLVGILWYGGHQVLQGHLSVGDIVAANFYVLMLIWPLRMLGMLLGQVPRAVAAAARIDDVLTTESRVGDRPGASALPAGPGAVRFDDVTFGYGDHAPVLRGFDLTVRGGESVALVGATASGKSTVARLIPRFYDVDSGCVCIDGVDVRDATLDSLRRSVGLVFEDRWLLWRTFTAGGSVNRLR